MAAQSGKNGQIIITEGTASIILGVRAWDIQDTQSVEDYTGMGSHLGWATYRKQFASTTSEWSGSAKGYIDSIDLGFTGDPPVIRRGMGGSIELYKIASTTSKYYGDVILTSVKPQVTVEGIINYDIAYQGVGTLMYPLA